MQLYQAITFNRSTESFFCGGGEGKAKKGQEHLSMVLNGDRVYLRDHKTGEAKIVFTSNVQYIQPYNSEDVIPIWSELIQQELAAREYEKIASERKAEATAKTLSGKAETTSK